MIEDYYATIHRKPKRSQSLRTDPNTERMIEPEKSKSMIDVLREDPAQPQTVYAEIHSSEDNPKQSTNVKWKFDGQPLKSRDDKKPEET